MCVCVCFPLHIITARCNVLFHLHTGFITAPESVSVTLESGSVDFNCSAPSSLTTSLHFLVDGQYANSLPISRGITGDIRLPGDGTVLGVINVPALAVNNNTEIKCRLTNDEIQSTSRPAVLTIIDCKLLCTETLTSSHSPISTAYIYSQYSQLIICLQLAHHVGKFNVRMEESARMNSCVYAHQNTLDQSATSELVHVYYACFIP